jgi:hypothetical protein
MELSFAGATHASQIRVKLKTAYKWNYSLRCYCFTGTEQNGIILFCPGHHTRRKHLKNWQKISINQYVFSFQVSSILT